MLLRLHRLCYEKELKLRTHQAPLKLFPATQPLEFVAIDILSPLDRASTGHRFILVMMDRFSKFTRAVPMRTCIALMVSKAFLEYWVFSLRRSEPRSCPTMVPSSPPQ